MIGKQQRLTFFAVGAGLFLLGVLLLILGFLCHQFVLRVMGPCFMLSGITWTGVVLAVLKFSNIPETHSPSQPRPEPEESDGGRVRLSESGFVDPTHCFCDIPDAEMRPWVTKRTIDHVSTMELLRSTDDPHEKEVISIVAMFDVDEGTLLSVMDAVDKPDNHIIACRKNVRKLLGVA